MGIGGMQNSRDQTYKNCTLVFWGSSNGNWYDRKNEILTVAVDVYTRPDGGSLVESSCRFSYIYNRVVFHI